MGESASASSEVSEATDEALSKTMGWVWSHRRAEPKRSPTHPLEGEVVQQLTGGETSYQD